MMDPNHEQNRRLWDEISEVHYHHPDYRVKEFLAGWNCLRSIERGILGEVTGKSLLHLFCQFGLDTLSWARLGADVVGVDISGHSIELAHSLKKQAGIEGEFVRSDVLDLIGKIDRRFDIVFQSYGTHHWIGNLRRWAEVVSYYLKPGGVFLMVDFHPIGLTYFQGIPYFDRGPHRYNDPDYADRSYVPKEESVEWKHTLGDIVNAVVGAGLVVERLEEYGGMAYRYGEDWVERDGYWYPSEGVPPYPMMFAVVGRKTGARSGEQE